MIKFETCSDCGITAAWDTLAQPSPGYCRICPPKPCEYCGGPGRGNCSCWIQLDGMVLADIKAVFARGGLSVGTEVNL